MEGVLFRLDPGGITPLSMYGGGDVVIITHSYKFNRLKKISKKFCNLNNFYYLCTKISYMWNKLSMAEKANIIALGVKSGITDLNSIRKTYNSFATGKSKNKNQ